MARSFFARHLALAIRSRSTAPARLAGVLEEHPMKLALAAILVVFSASAVAQTYVRPHVRSNGTYVEGHYRSSPNNTRIDNYGSQGNINPYTGQAGSRNPYGQ